MFEHKKISNHGCNHEYGRKRKGNLSQKKKKKTRQCYK